MHAGKKSNNKQFDTYGAPYGQNDVIGCLLDWDSDTISFSKNGEDLGPAFQIPGQVQGKALFPAVCLKNAELVINFGEQKLQYGPPKKSVALAKAPQEWISSGQGQQSEFYPYACMPCVLFWYAVTPWLMARHLLDLHMMLTMMSVCCSVLSVHPSQHSHHVTLCVIELIGEELANVALHQCCGHLLAGLSTTRVPTHWLFSALLNNERGVHLTTVYKVEKCKR